jgi:hypothetical protein
MDHISPYCIQTSGRRYQKYRTNHDRRTGPDAKVARMITSCTPGPRSDQLSTTLLVSPLYVHQQPTRSPTTHSINHNYYTYIKLQPRWQGRHHLFVRGRFGISSLLPAKQKSLEAVTSYRITKLIIENYYYRSRPARH